MLTMRRSVTRLPRHQAAEPAGVAFVISELTVGGLERAVLDLINRLDRARFRPVLCCMKQSGRDSGRNAPKPGIFPPETESALDGLPVYEGLTRSKYDAMAVLRLARIIRRHRVKVVFAVGGRDALLWGPLAGKVARAPVVVGAVHSMRPGVLLWPHRLVLRRVDAVVAVAEKMRHDLAAGDGIPAARIAVIHNGIEPEIYDRPSGGRALRSALGLRDGAPLVGIVAALRKIKCHEMFLQAASLVVREFPEARFVIVGDGPERERLQGLQRQLKLDRAVHFLGHRTDVPEILAALDVFALSSGSEAFPIAVLEAMAAGKPVVATNVGAVAEAVDDGETGYLVEAGDAQALARATCELLRDRERARRMGLAGRRRVRSLFTLDENAARTERLLLALLRAKSAAPREAAPVSVEMVDTDQGFYSLRDEWTELLADSDTNSVFVTWEWMWAWWQTFREGKDLCLLLVREPGGRLIGIAPLYIGKAAWLKKLRVTEVRFLSTGEPLSPDYLGVIAARGKEKHVAQAVLTHMVSQRGWAAIRLREMAEDSPGLSALESAARELNLKTWRSPRAVCPRGPLPASWEAYLQSVSKNTRHSIRRRIRRLEEECEVRFFRWERERPIAEGIGQLVRLHRLRWEPGVHEHAFADPRCADFHRLAARLFYARDWLRLYTLEVNQQVAAMAYCFLYNGILHYFQSGFDPQWSSSGVGIVCLAKGIQDAIEEGATALDLLKGSYDYKYMFVSGEKRSVDLVIASSTAQGKAAHLSHLCRRYAKQALPRPLLAGARRLRAAMRWRAR